jgi:CRP/FNR family cyclic AMP-dependent transcriptional regulator
MQLAEPQGRRWVVKEKLTHHDIADRIGCSREMVSRVVRKMQHDGTISLEANRIVINKKPV